MVQAFSASPAEMEVEKGGQFSLLHGNIIGEFVDLVSGYISVTRLF